MGTEPKPTTGIVRVLFVAAGVVCVGLAYLGAILPGLPTTPWVLLASYCFSRSSPRLRAWLLRSPIFGKLLRDWHEHRGMRRPAKWVAVAMIAAACTFSVGFAGLPDGLRIAIAVSCSIGVCVVIFVVPTIRGSASEVDATRVGPDADSDGTLLRGAAMADVNSYDVIVIGAGPAGVNAAVTAALLGQSVLVVEKNKAVGGAGANTGTLPSKTLRETALAFSGMRTRRLCGIDLSLKREVTVDELLFHERMVKHAEQSQIVTMLDKVGVPLVQGAAEFVDSNTVRVVTPGGGPDMQYRAKFIVIAIGSTPVRPAMFPFEHPRVLDSDEIVELHEIPKCLAVIGAGVIGSEYACMFAALEGKVHLIDGRDTLMPFLDLDVSQTLGKAMTDLGIEFHWGAQVTACEVPESGNLKLSLSTGTVVEADAVLVAAGRASQTDKLNPDAAGLLLGKRGLIPVNAHFQTNVPHIYAVGDVIGFPALASTSAEQGRVAACHLAGNKLMTDMPTLLPTGIYTIPEAAMVGETEGSLKSHGIEYVAGRADYRDNARGKIIGDETGFLKLLFRKSDMALIGIHVIGEQATELVHVGLMAMRAGGGADLLLHTCFNYPTLGNLYKMATFEAIRARNGGFGAILSD